MYCSLLVPDSAFLKSQINNGLSQINSPPALPNLNTKILIQHMYYGEQLVNISFAMPLHDVKFGLHAD
jgi:hypothetical protein